MRLKNGALVAALLALTGNSVANAQSLTPPCVEDRELADAATFAAPAALDALRGKCGPSLSPTGFLATKGKALGDRFASRRAASWPGALSLLTKVGAKGDPQIVDMMRSLPAEAAQPFIEALLVQKIDELVPVGDCATIERALELAEPLPAENMIGLLVVAARANKLKDPPLCVAKTEL